MMPRAKSAMPLDVARNGHIAAALRAALKQRKWTLGDLNAAMDKPRGWSNSYHWLSCKGAPGAEIRPLLSKVTGIPQADLMPRGSSRELVPITVTLEPPVKLPAAVPMRDVLTFSVNSAGETRIRLDIVLPRVAGSALLRMLLDAGVVMGGDDGE